MKAPDFELEVHSALMDHAEGGISAIYDIWKKKRKVPPFLLAWPAEELRDQDGQTVNDVCRMALPDDRSKWGSQIRQAVELTRAFAILLVEQRPKDVHLIFESEYGTKSWSIPIERRGDVCALGKPTTKVDVESVGVLWRPRRAQA